MTTYRQRCGRAWRGHGQRVDEVTQQSKPSFSPAEVAEAAGQQGGRAARQSVAKSPADALTFRHLQRRLMK